MGKLTDLEQRAAASLVRLAEKEWKEREAEESWNTLETFCQGARNLEKEMSRIYDAEDIASGRATAHEVHLRNAFIPDELAQAARIIWRPRRKKKGRKPFPQPKQQKKIQRQDDGSDPTDG